MLSRRNLPLALLLLTVLLVYANSLGNSFHFDDFHTVTDNPAVRSLTNLPRIVSDATAFSVLPANQTYRPVVTASLAFDYALAHGYTPFWFHLSTLIWFLVLVWVLTLWAEDIFQKTLPDQTNRWLALAVAAWFGLHPAMAETVNYVIQRGDLYCTLGCLAALVAYARWPLQRRWGVYLIPFGLALLSKPPAAVFPLLLFFYAALFEHGDQGPARRWALALRHATPSLLLTGLLMWFEAHMTPRSYAPTILSASAYRLTQPYVWWRYAEALFWPFHLNVDTDLQPLAGWSAQAVGGVFFALGLLTAIVLCARQRRLRPVAYGLLWFLLTQLPTSVYALSEVENDHRMFFSFPGLMLAVVWLLALGYRAARRTRPTAAATSARPYVLPRAAALVCGLLLCGFAYGAHHRNAVWHDEATLWADDVAKSPHNGRGLMIYGLTKMNEGDLEGALRLFERAQRYTPNYPTLEVNLGVVQSLLARQGRPAALQQAEAHFQRAVALAPGDDVPHAYYGRWLLQQGRLPAATEQLHMAVELNNQRIMQRDLLMEADLSAGRVAEGRELARSTLRLAPGDGEALAVLRGGGAGNPTQNAAVMVNTSLAAYKAGDYAGAIHDAEAALRLDPRSAEAWNNLGAGYGAMHQWELGITAEQRALTLNPGLQIAANNLHWFEAQQAASLESKGQKARPKTAAELINASLVLSQEGQFERSVDAAKQALAIDPHSAEAWNNVAAGEEALHHWPAAIIAAQHAVALRPDFQLARNNLAWSVAQQQASLHQGTAGGRAPATARNLVP